VSKTWVGSVRVCVFLGPKSIPVLAGQEKKTQGVQTQYMVNKSIIHANKHVFRNEPAVPKRCLCKDQEVLYMLFSSRFPTLSSSPAALLCCATAAHDGHPGIYPSLLSQTDKTHGAVGTNQKKNRPKTRPRLEGGHMTPRSRRVAAGRIRLNSTQLLACIRLPLPLPLSLWTRIREARSGHVDEQSVLVPLRLCAYASYCCLNSTELCSLHVPCKAHVLVLSCARVSEGLLVSRF
jgi:hypothetical protein